MSFPYVDDKVALGSFLAFRIIFGFIKMVLDDMVLHDGPTGDGGTVGDDAATCNTEQPQLSVARLASQEFQHLLRFGAGQPSSLSHGCSACPLTSRSRRKLRQSLRYIVNGFSWCHSTI